MYATVRELSILGRASKADVVTDPFPHLVTRNALREDLYEQLASEFPNMSVMAGDARPEDAKYYFLGAAQARTRPDVSALWKEFMAYHTSPAFFQEVVALFGNHIRTMHPHLELAFDKRLEAFSAAARDTEAERDADVRLECQLVSCTTALRRATPKGPHVDREVALYAGLLYFRMDADDSTGGDLEIQRFRGVPHFEAGTNEIPDDRVETVKTITYEKNTLVFFIHSAHSLHAVSARSATPYPRRHVNFVAEFAHTKAFDIAPFRNGMARAAADRGGIQRGIGIARRLLRQTRGRRQPS
ncbi:MAG TPA: hypothetical protein VF166_15400 [Gemmatimonadaceae bacterium]